MTDRRLSGFPDGLLSDREQQELATHLSECGDCRARTQQFGRLRDQLHHLPLREPPAEVKTALRVLASREANRRRASARGGAISLGATRFNLWANDLMRPLAIPFAGGIVSALVLFSMLVPSFSIHTPSISDDVPTVLTTEATLKGSMPVGDLGDGLVVDLVIDEQGRMVSYSIPHGQGAFANDAELRRAIENRLLFTSFEPATAFGHPMPGRVRISFRRSYIDVKG